MTQKQKALIEKAVKVRFNGLITHLESAQSTQEQELQTQILRITTPRYSSKASLANREQQPPEWQERMNKLQELTDEMHKRHREECREDEERWSELVREAQEYNSALTKRIQECRLARTKVVAGLREQRDQMILTTAFDGEDDNVLAILDSMPKADDVVKMLAEVGLELTKEITLVSGIGDRALPGTLSE